MKLVRTISDVGTLPSLFAFSCVTTLDQFQVMTRTGQSIGIGSPWLLTNWLVSQLRTPSSFQEYGVKW